MLDLYVKPGQLYMYFFKDKLINFCSSAWKVERVDMGGKLMYNVCVLLVFESFSNSVLEKSIDFKEFENFAGIYSAIYKIKRNSINVT